jgi:hypothetical protein
MLTLHHPWLDIRQANDWGNTQGRDGWDRFVHCSVCEGVIILSA